MSNLALFPDLNCELFTHDHFVPQMTRLLYALSCTLSSPCSQPYKSPPNGGGGRGSVFSRLGASSGGSSGSVFSRLSGLGGERPGGRGASWHKITVSHVMHILVPNSKVI